MTPAAEFLAFVCAFASWRTPLASVLRQADQRRTSLTAQLELYRTDIYGDNRDNHSLPAEELEAPSLFPGLKSSSSVFRTRTCTTDAAHANVSDVVTASYVIDRLSVVRNIRSPKLACVVYSHRGARQEMRDSFATWGQDCDVFLPFSDEQFYDKEAGFTTIEVHPASGDERDLIGKLKEVFKEVSRRILAKELEFDFLTVSGDDTFWLLGNLKEYLQADPRIQDVHNSGEGVYLGRRLAVDGNESNVFNSGAGYVINQVSLERYLQGCPREEEGWWEDAFLGRCLLHHGIVPLPTEDGAAQRFCIFPPRIMMRLNYHRGNWIESYSRPFPNANGLAGISNKPVLFHYVKGDKRYDLHNRLFLRANCDRSRSSYVKMLGALRH